jgi:hypothetical protein
MSDNNIGPEARVLPLVRGSEITSFKRCPQAWYWGWEVGLTPRIEKQDALWVGTGVHLAMAEWYVPGTVRGTHPRDTWEQYAKAARAQMMTETYNAGSGEFERQWESTYDLIGNLMDEYVIHWGEDESWDVLAPEQRFAVDIPRFVREDGKWVPFSNEAFVKFIGTYDLPIRDLSDGRVKIVDHKTAKAITTNHLGMDPQANGYCAVGTHTLRELGKIGPKEVVSGMLYNFIRKGKQDERPRDAEGYCLNQNGTRSKTQPSPLFERHFIQRNTFERNGQIVRISQDAERMQKAREEIASGVPPMKAFSRECTWCSFFELCELDNSGGDTEYYKESVFKTHDMYGDHREGATNSKTGLADLAEAEKERGAV